MKRYLILTSIIISTFFIKQLHAGQFTETDAVKKALEFHPLVKIAESYVEEAKGEQLSELTLPLPRLTLRYNDAPLGSGISKYEQNRMGITQDFDFPIKYKWRKDLSDMRIEKARFESESLLLDVEAEVRKLYIEAWAASEKIKIIEDYNTKMQALAAQIEGMEKIGNVSKFDAQQAAGELKDAEYELNDYRLSKKVSIANLARIMNVSADEIEFVSPLEHLKADSFYEIEKTAFSDNPEYQTADAELKAATKSCFIESREWLPDFEFFYFQEYRRFDKDPDTWGMQFEMSLPLWYFLGGKGEAKISKAEMKRAQAELEVCELQIISEWSELFWKYKSASDKYSLYQRELIPMDEQSYNRAKMEYSVGETDVMEIAKTLKRWKRTKIDSLETAVEMMECKIEMDRLEGISVIEEKDSRN